MCGRIFLFAHFFKTNLCIDERGLINFRHTSIIDMGGVVSGTNNCDERSCAVCDAHRNIPVAWPRHKPLRYHGNFVRNSSHSKYRAGTKT